MYCCNQQQQQQQHGWRVRVRAPVPDLYVLLYLIILNIIFRFCTDFFETEKSVKYTQKNAYTPPSPHIIHIITCYYIYIMLFSLAHCIMYYISSNYVPIINIYTCPQKKCFPAHTILTPVWIPGGPTWTNAVLFDKRSLHRRKRNPALEH